jgi:hypothetical protein
MPFRIGKAIAYAVLIWLVGFIWGSIVFLTPSLSRLRPIPFVSKYPAISFPILAIWLVLSYLIAWQFLRKADDPIHQGLKLGLTFAAVNLILDVLVLVLLLRAGPVYFVSLTVWSAYLMLVVVPWLTGRSLAKTLPEP